MIDAETWPWEPLFEFGRNPEIRMGQMTLHQHHETLWDAMAREFESQTGPCPDCWDEDCILTPDHERFTECGKCYVEWAHFKERMMPQIAGMNREQQRAYIARQLGANP